MSTTADEIKERNKQIAATIYNQLSHGTMRMLGAYDIFYDGPALSFKIRGSKKWKHIKIALNSMDTYDLTFSTWRKVGYEEKLTQHKIEGIHVEQLHEIIERETGLYTKL